MFWIIAAIFGWCTLLLVLLLKRTGTPQEPQRRENVVIRVDELLTRAAWHREQLEAETEEFLELHGYPLNSWETIELAAVMAGVEDYDTVVQRIMDRYKTEEK